MLCYCGVVVGCYGSPLGVKEGGATGIVAHGLPGAVEAEEKLALGPAEDVGGRGRQGVPREAND